jgi:hypothetical protein
MARAKSGLWSKYRGARARLAEPEALREVLQRTRPRTRGKKAAKTRTLNKIARQIPAAKGLLTKARNAIAEAARGRKSPVSDAKEKRSEAARKGWAKRRAPSAANVASTASAVGDIWQHLLPDGATTTVVLDKADSSLEGLYWNAFEDARAGKRGLWEFTNLSVLDLDRQRRFPFVTDLNVIAEHADEIDFGPGFYKRRSDAPGNTA